MQMISFRLWFRSKTFYLTSCGYFRRSDINERENYRKVHSSSIETEFYAWSTLLGRDRNFRNSNKHSFVLQILCQNTLETKTRV